MKLPRKKATRKTASTEPLSIVLDSPKTPQPSRKPAFAGRSDFSSYVVPFRRVIE